MAHYQEAAGSSPAGATMIEVRRYKDGALVALGREYVVKNGAGAQTIVVDRRDEIPVTEHLIVFGDFGKVLEALKP